MAHANKGRTQPKRSGDASLRCIASRFVKFTQTYSHHFNVAHQNVSAKARAYTTGLVMKASRKNMERMEEYQTIAEQLISDGRGYLPNGSDIKYVNGGGTRPPFKEHCEYIDRQIILASTGGLLTMLSEPGSGTLAGSAHYDTFMQIARSDASVLSGVLQNAIDIPLLAEYFPGQPVQAYFEFATDVNDDTKQVVKDAVELAKVGLRIDVNELAEKTGYSLTEV